MSHTGLVEDIMIIFVLVLFLGWWLVITTEKDERGKR